MKNGNKTLHIKRRSKQSSADDTYTPMPTVEISLEESGAEIPVLHRSYLEVIGSDKKNRVIELGETEILIGRNPECRLQLLRNTVSRKHARVFFRNEEYHIEDLGSTNGTLVNGVRIERSVLRNKDQIHICGVKILFNEEQSLIET